MRTVQPHFSIPMRRSLSILTLALALLTTSAPHLSRASAESAADLDASERKKLRAGEIVVRPKNEARGRLQLIGGTSYLIIDASPEEVWRAVRDAPNFHKMLPQAHTTDVLARSDEHARVRLSHSYGPMATSYVLDLRFLNETRVMMFRLNERYAGGMEAGWGFIRIGAYARGQTLISFGAMVDIGQRLGTNLVKGQIHEWLLKVPLTMKWHLEGDGRTAYQAQKPD